jgi:hypothetical protein
MDLQNGTFYSDFGVVEKHVAQWHKITDAKIARLILEVPPFL